MKQNVYPSIHIEDQVLGINLENNRLESLENGRLPPNLIHLYLSNNSLKRLPDSIFENQEKLKNLSLSENPWSCDCNALKFKKWLTSNHKYVRILCICDSKISYVNTFMYYVCVCV